MMGILRKGWKDLDRILRGDATRPSSIKGGSVEVSVVGLTLVLLALAMAYGACMGCFALSRARGPSYLQLLASTVKVPLLFVLTLAVTLPSLYVFNALVGSRLAIGGVLRLLLAALAVMVAVLASLGPIVAFFSLSTTSYPFMQVVNVVAFGAAGTLGLAFLLQTLQRLSESSSLPIEPEPEPEPEAGPGTEAGSVDLAEGLEGAGVPARIRPPGALEAPEGQVLNRHVKVVFRVWMVLFGLVGAQMSWVLRPFIGDPSIDFEWFRARDSNFFQAVLKALASLFS